MCSVFNIQNNIQIGCKQNSQSRRTFLPDPLRWAVCVRMPTYGLRCCSEVVYYFDRRITYPWAHVLYMPDHHSKYSHSIATRFCRKTSTSLLLQIICHTYEFKILYIIKWRKIWFFFRINKTYLLTLTLFCLLSDFSSTDLIAAGSVQLQKCAVNLNFKLCAIKTNQMGKI